MTMTDILSFKCTATFLRETSLKREVISNIFFESGEIE